MSQQRSKRPRLSSGYRPAISVIGSPHLTTGVGHIAVYRLIVRNAYQLRKIGTTIAEVEERMGEDGKFVADWRVVSKTALKKRVPFHEATPRQLYDVARYVLSKIDAHKATDQDVDWYPDGWQEAADIVRGEIERVHASEMSDDERRELMRRQAAQLIAEREAAQ